MANKFFNSASVAEALKTKGYNVEVKEVVKNGVVKVGYVFLDGENSAKPTIYLGEDAPSEPSEAADYLISIYNAAPAFVLDVDTVTDWNTAKNNLVLSVCGTGKEKVACKTMLNLDLYARVNVGNHGTVKVTEELLKTWGKSLDEVLEVANENIRKDVLALDITTALFGFVGADALDLDNLDCPMVVISNSSKCFGAGQMFNNEVLERVSNYYESDLFILPSSIHEIIVLPESLGGAVEELAEMVKDVNNTAVSPEDVLTYSVYKFERKEKRLTLAK